MPKIKIMFYMSFFFSHVFGNCGMPVRNKGFSFEIVFLQPVEASFESFIFKTSAVSNFIYLKISYLVSQYKLRNSSRNFNSKKCTNQIGLLQNVKQDHYKKLVQISCTHYKYKIMKDHIPLPVRNVL